MQESQSIEFNENVDEDVLNMLFQSAANLVPQQNLENHDDVANSLFQSAADLYTEPINNIQQQNIIKSQQQQQQISQSLHLEELQNDEQIVQQHANITERFSMENLIEQSLIQSSVNTTQLTSAFISSLQQFSQLAGQAQQTRNQLANNALHSKNHEQIVLNSDDVEQLSLLFRTLFGQLSYHKIMFFLSYKQQELLSKMKIEIQFYRNYMVKLPVINEDKIMSQLDDQPSTAKAKDQVQEELYKECNFNSEIFQQELENYNLFISKADVQNQQLIQRNAYLIREINNKIENEKQFLHLYSSIQFINKCSVQELDDFEIKNQCLALYFDDDFVFQDKNLLKIKDILEYNQAISFPKIYQFTIKYGIKKLDYNDLCCKLVILLSYFLSNIEKQQMHPVLLVYQLVQQIKLEQKIISGQPIISQFYNKDILPSSNSYNFLCVFYIKNQKVLVLTDGFYLIKCQILKIKENYKNGQIYTLFNPQMQGFSSEQQYMLDQPNFASNYLVCQESQIKSFTEQKIGFYQYKTQYQYKIFYNQVISHHTFIVLDQINLLLVLMSINNKQTYYFISREYVSVGIGQVLHIFQFTVKQALHTKINVIQSTLYFPSENKQFKQYICKNKNEQQRYQSFNEIVSHKISNLYVIKITDESLILSDQNDSIYVLQVYMTKNDMTIQEMLCKLIAGNSEEGENEILSLQNRKLEIFNTFHEIIIQNSVQVNRLYFISGVSEINLGNNQNLTISTILKEKLERLNVQLS